MSEKDTLLYLVLEGLSMRKKIFIFGTVLAVIGTILVILRQFFKKSMNVLFTIYVCPSVLIGFIVIIVGIGLCGYGIGIQRKTMLIT